MDERPAAVKVAHADDDRRAATAVRRLIWLVPFAFGGIAVALGQDANWDLRNYHWYVAWAFLTDRLGIDLAPAGAQSYFNPLLDLPYYALSQHFSPRAVAFFMGTLHGLNFVAVFVVAQLTLPFSTPARTVFLLALAGCLGVTFFAGLGNTMGDNLTATFSLFALAILLSRVVPQQTGGAGFAAVAGLLAGLGCGLKLSNAPFTLALGVALTVITRRRERPFAAPAAFALAAVLGVVATGGVWFLTMWREFGNPLFPQFNTLFQSELAAKVSLIDTRWQPGGLLDALTLPWQWLLSPRRFHEVITFPVLWPVAFTLLLIWLASALAGHWRGGPGANTGVIRSDLAATRVLLIFVGVSYALWLAVFGVGRYLVAVELLLPLLIWLAVRRLCDRTWLRRAAGTVIAIAVAASVLRFDPWGHAAFADVSMRVADPGIESPSNATVLVLDAPVAWMLPQFPAGAAYIGLVNFPESDAYRRRVVTMLSGRGDGKVYALVSAFAPPATDNLSRLDGWTSRLGLPPAGVLCQSLRRGLSTLPKFRDLLATARSDSMGPGCHLSSTMVLPGVDATENQTRVRDASRTISGYGLALDPSRCALREGHIGQRAFAFQFCRASRTAQARP